MTKALIALFVISNLIWYYFAFSRNTTLLESCQPESVKYEQYGTSCLRVKAGRKEFSLIDIEQKTYIFVGHDSSYGFYQDYDFHPGYDSLEDYLRNKVTVTWDQAGVTLKEASGQTLFIPAANFTGGR